MSPITLELPYPPSVNRIWRAKRSTGGKPQFYRDPKYQAWLKTCTGELWVAGWVGGWATKQRGYALPIHEPVSVEVVLDATRSARADCDNRLKACLDMLERARVIENDRQVVKASIYWGHAEKGCRITIASEPKRPIRNKEAA